MTKALGVIPARKGSQRFPDKHHATLLGRPMFVYTLEAARAARRLDHLVVTSDDLTLKPLAESLGIEFLMRPAELCTPTAALDDAIRHVCRVMESRDGFVPDVIVTLLGNVPVRKPGQIDEVVERLRSVPDATAVCTAQQLRDRPEWAKRLGEGGRAEPFLTGHTAFRAQDYPSIYSMDGAVAAVRRNVLFETEGNRTAHAWFGPRPYLVIQDHAMYSLEVDYPDEQALAEFYLLYQRHGADWRRHAHKPCTQAGTPNLQSLDR